MIFVPQGEIGIKPKELLTNTKSRVGLTRLHCLIAQTKIVDREVWVSDKREQTQIQSWPQIKYT